jgi:putative ABC transport system permease protein
VWRVALKGWGARRLRVLLTAGAVALGVALIAGTYVLTDTINRSFDQIFATANEGIDVAVTPRDALDADEFETTASPTIPPSLVRRVERVEGVDAVSGSIFSPIAIFDAEGDRIGSNAAPSFVSGVQREPFEVFTFPEGRAPRAPGEVALNESAAERAEVGVGDRIRLAGVEGARAYRLVGVTQFGGGEEFGAFVAVTTTPEAQRLTGKTGFDEVDVSARPGVTPEQLERAVRDALPASVEVRTGAEQAERNASDIQDDLSFLRTALLAFAGIALFVGAFLIFNTFSITVAQRTREFALLRTLGANRGQVLRSVVAECLVLGAVGGLVGLALGIALAPGLRALFAAIGADLPAQGTVVAARTVVVALLVGTAVTVLSGLAPALRATRVPPIAALREGAVLPRGRFGRLATPASVVLGVLGAVALGFGLFGGLETDPALSLVGAGAGALFLGVALLTPKLVPPIAAGVGAPLQALRGVTGRLARENAVRQPGRTAVTAAALMVGVALIAFVSIFAAGAKSSISDAVETALADDTLIVQGSGGFAPLPPQASRAVERVDAVRATSPVGFSVARVRGERGKTSVSTIDPRTFGLVYRADWVEEVRDLGRDGVLLSEGHAEETDLAPGDTVRLTTPIGRRLTLEVRGVVDDEGGLLAPLTVSTDLGRTAFGEREDAFVFVKLAPGADMGAAQRAIERRLDAAFPVAEVLTGDEFVSGQADQINQLLTLIYVLLALSVVVSLFGIVNTLALSIHERTRELGMLRAIGASRAQVRAMVRYEAVITSLIGAVLGIALGCVLAAAVGQPLRDDGFELSFPVVTLVALVVLAAVAGVVMAIGPARRAARLDVLRALAYE